MLGLLELLTTRHYMISPDFVHGVRSMIQANLNNHVALEDEKKQMGCRVLIKSDGIATDIKMLRYSAKDGRYVSRWNDNTDDPFISVLFVDGPITRNGGACSYGSAEHRDMMMSSADNKHCVGHVFFINTPGGSAWAKNDYQQAIDYAHSKKQPVVAFIDGMCASAGMYLAALCDERYYMHPKDQIGCIGVMAAFYSTADGSKNEYTDETYHELYDPESYDKNKEYRDIANDNDTKLLVKELADLGVEFRADVKRACPKATDEHLHGKIFDAEEVKGILMDGQKNLGEVFMRVIDLGAKAGVPAAKEAKGMTAHNPRYGGLEDGKNMSNHINKVEMKEQFPAVFALLGVEEMQVNEEGTFFNKDLLGTLNAAIEKKNQELADAQKLANELTANNTALTEQLEAKGTEMEQLKADNQKAIDDLNAEHKAEIDSKEAEIATLKETEQNLKADVDGKQASIDQLTNDLNGAKESLTTAENTIAERDQTITDMQAKLDEVAQGAGAQPAAGAQPQNNGQQTAAPKVVVSRKVMDPSKSYDENKAMLDAE